MNESEPRQLDDAYLADWLKKRERTGNTVGYLQADSLCKVADLGIDYAPLLVADPGKISKPVLKKLADRNLLRYLELSFEELTSSWEMDPAWEMTPITRSEIDRLLKTRDELLGRTRGPKIDNKVAWKVWADAGGRCMYRGCGKDLSGIELHSQPIKIGYLAHIIASNPRGPRGDSELSHKLATDPDNIMLMCDEHHRLIDVFEPAEHTAECLHEMREEHRKMVRFYMEALSYPRVRAITLLANLANVPTRFSTTAYMEALLDMKRAMWPEVNHHLRREQRDDRRTPEFWKHYLHDHELDIRALVCNFKDIDSKSADEIAVFPLHHVATLVLAGRIIGEARPTLVFQYDRQRKTWRWDPKAESHPDGTFNVAGLMDEEVEEVLMSIELTANLDKNSLPKDLAEPVANGRIPWVRIRTSDPNPGCIRHPDDLQQFRDIARKAISHVQDVMRASHVHLIIISPASTAFSFGQILQAGHHPKYTVYDRASHDIPFIAALSITGYEVTAGTNDSYKSIEIR